MPYRPWDVSFGGGFHSLQDADGGLTPQGPWGDDLQASWAASVDVGRYWTGHLKTETSVTFLQRRRDIAISPIDVGGGVRADAYTRADIDRAQVGVGATWQLLENALMHPYVSAGARVSVLGVDEVRDPFVWVWSGSSYVQRAVPALSRQHVDVRVRPYVAVGSKSYFSERVFARPELVLGFNGSGMSQFGARLAIGIDF